MEHSKRSVACKVLRQYSSRQASISRATKQLMPTPRVRRLPPTQGGGQSVCHIADVRLGRQAEVISSKCTAA